MTGWSSVHRAVSGGLSRGGRQTLWHTSYWRSRRPRGLIMAARRRHIVTDRCDTRPSCISLTIHPPSSTSGRIKFDCCLPAVRLHCREGLPPALSRSCVLSCRQPLLFAFSDDEDDDVPIAALAAKHQIAAPAKHRPAPAAAAASTESKMKTGKKKAAPAPSDYSAKRSKTKGSTAGETRNSSSSSSRSRSSTPTRTKAAAPSSVSKSKKYADFTPGKVGLAVEAECRRRQTSFESASRHRVH